MAFVKLLSVIIQLFNRIGNVNIPYYPEFTFFTMICVACQGTPKNEKSLASRFRKYLLKQSSWYQLFVMSHRHWYFFHTSPRLMTTLAARCLFHPLRPPRNLLVVVSFQTWNSFSRELTAIFGGKALKRGVKCCFLETYKRFLDHDIHWRVGWTRAICKMDLTKDL